MNNVLSNKKYIAIFVLPAFIFYTVFVLFPIGYNVYLSFFRTNLMGNSTFIGITNYINLINDQFFVMAFKNNIFLMIGSLLAHLPLALFFANALFQKIKGSKIFQYVFFLPTVICGVAVGMMFNFVYNSEFGIVNKILDIINLEIGRAHV